ncbi:MAG: T9SS type A sorting domain-containing protein, partial [Flavobacteriales bacterium]
VYIEDIILNTYTKINDIESYEVTLTNDLNGIGRFYLYTSSSNVLSTETNLVGSPIHLYKTSNGTVKITGLTSGSAATFSLFTILGKEVFATKFIAQNVKEISLPASLFSGVYIAGVVSNSGTFHKKIIIE